MRLKDAAGDIRTIKKLLTGAEAEAHRAGDLTPGAEHLLLSALSLPDGSAHRAFTRIDADPAQLPGAISDAHAAALASIGIHANDDDTVGPATESAGPNGPLRVNASAQAAFQAAVKLSKGEKPSKLLGAHVVIAVAQNDYGTATRALKTMGVDRQALVEAARAELQATRAL